MCCGSLSSVGLKNNAAVESCDGLVVVDMESFETHLEFARCDLLPAFGSSFDNFFEVILY